MHLNHEQGFSAVQPTATVGYENPLAPDRNTADPSVVYCQKSGCYYGIHTGDKYLTLYRAKRLGELFRGGESKIIYEANDADDTYGFLWAPELHLIDGRWYIYTSTHQTATNKGKKHVICLRAKSDDLFDGFELAAHINKELYAIDPTFYCDKKSGKLYICYSPVIDGIQKLAIQEMKSPTEPTGDFTVIAEPVYDWELVPPYDELKINEGAYFIENAGRLFIVYSANGCWSDDYVLGILEFTGNNMLDAASWTKHDVPLMVKGNGNFGPGHATFFRSPDGSELWIAHHCLHESDPENVAMARHCHCQKVFFDKTGFPYLGTPVPQGVVYQPPSGE